LGPFLNWFASLIICDHRPSDLIGFSIPISPSLRDRLETSIDIMIFRVRKRLINAARAYHRNGELPACAARPEAYAGVRGGHFLGPKADDWLVLYRRELAAAPADRAQPRVPE